MGRCAPRAEGRVHLARRRKRQQCRSQVVGVGDDRPWMPRHGVESRPHVQRSYRGVVAEDDRHPVRTSSTRRPHSGRDGRVEPRTGIQYDLVAGERDPAHDVRVAGHDEHRHPLHGAGHRGDGVAGEGVGQVGARGAGQPQTALRERPALDRDDSRPGLRGKGHPLILPIPGDVLDIPPAGDHNAGDPHPTEGSV